MGPGRAGLFRCRGTYPTLHYAHEKATGLTRAWPLQARTACLTAVQARACMAAWQQSGPAGTAGPGPTWRHGQAAACGLWQPSLSAYGLWRLGQESPADRAGPQARDQAQPCSRLRAARTRRSWHAGLQLVTVGMGLVSAWG